MYFFLPVRLVQWLNCDELDEGRYRKFHRPTYTHKTAQWLSYINWQFLFGPFFVTQPLFVFLVEPGILRFGEKIFFCLDGDRKVMKKFSFSYADVTLLVLRVRALHLDIRCNSFCIFFFWAFLTFEINFIDLTILLKDFDCVPLLYKPLLMNYFYALPMVKYLS